MVKRSDGKVGEERARYAFKQLGWNMFRTQPAIRIIKSLGGGQYIVVFKSGGICDYTGHDEDGKYIACEVKESMGESMPCSRLDKHQREFMDTVKSGHAYVGIYWSENGTFSVQMYKKKGSYKRTDGIAC